MFYDSFYSLCVEFMGMIKKAHFNKVLTIEQQEDFMRLRCAIIKKLEEAIYKHCPDLCDMCGSSHNENDNICFQCRCDYDKEH